MKKQIIICVVAFLAGSFITPIAAMGIGETRSLILGLAPEDAIVSLADQIDETKSTTSAAVSDTKSIVDQQQAIIDEQNQKLTDLQKVTDAQVTKDKSDEIKKCLSKKEYCENNITAKRNAIDGFNKQIKELGENSLASNGKKQSEESLNKLLAECGNYKELTCE